MTNVGILDRLLRFLVGMLVAVGVMWSQTAGWLESWGNWVYAVIAVGLILMLTATVGFCPAYSLFGFKASEKS